MHDKHIPGLDGLRGLAAVIVALNHAPKFGLSKVVEQGAGNYGVMLFFILSGFLMAHLYLDRTFSQRDASSYIVARITRIVPLYYFVLLISFCITFYAPSGWPFQMSAAQLLLHLLFIGNVSVFWSIGPEFQFYFFFILIWWAWSRKVDGKPSAFYLVVIFSVLAYILNGYFPGTLFLSKLHIFWTGILACALLKKVIIYKPSPMSVTFIQVSALFVLMAILWPPVEFARLIYPYSLNDPKFLAYYANLGRVGAAGFIIFCFSFKSVFSRLIFGNAFARFLGNCCFSIYLLHIPVFYAVKHLKITELYGPSAGLILAMFVVLLLSYGSYRLIETPSRTCFRGPLLRTLSGIQIFLFGKQDIAVR